MIHGQQYKALYGETQIIGLLVAPQQSQHRTPRRDAQQKSLESLA
jgi:hypothetical protein